MDGINTTDPLDTLKKIDNLWYDDADVIFCTGNSKFRVFRGILAAQSTIFRDMFEMPQNSEEVAGEGSAVKANNNATTVITLPDDEKDVYYFFLAIFDASFYNAPPSTYEFEVTVSILRLAHKYNVPFLNRRAVGHLDSFFPLDKQSLNKIARLDASDDESMADIDEEEERKELKGYLDMLQLAYITDTLWIVPSLLYILIAKFGVSFIIPHPSFVQLASRFQVLIVEYATASALEDDNRNTWIGMVPSVKCTTLERCRYLSRTLQKNDHLLPPGTCVGDCTIDFELDGKTFCRNCQTTGTRYQEALAAKYWNNYPVVCGFESWDEVRKLRSTALTVSPQVGQGNVWKGS